ncbi:MAG: S24 family peptidase, partial [Plesiomonas sp.]
MGTTQKDPILDMQIGSLKTVRERVEYLINGASVNSKAKMWGVPTSTIAGMLERGTEPSIRNAVKIAAAEGVTLQWLATGLGPMRVEQNEKKSETTHLQTPTNSVSIPMYEVDAAAGAGSWINEENVADYWLVPQSWLRLERLEHAELCIINTIGDSMTPTINNGDRLLVKLNINREKALEGVFVINLDG